MTCFLAQAAPADVAALGWEAAMELIQLSGMAGVAAVLLVYFLRQSREQNKTFRALSVTMISYQSQLLIYSTTRINQSVGADDIEQCKRLTAAVESVAKLLEHQRTELERIYAAEK